MMPLYLPGSQEQRMTRYEVVDGVAVVEGDMMLGPANQLPVRYGIPWAPMNVKGAVASANRSHVWPQAQIPYAIDDTVGQEMRGFIAWAIDHVNTTELKLRPKSAADRDYIVFTQNGDGCSSYLGRIGGAQEVILADCGRGSVVHEILHAAGFYHEQSRGDRDQFVTIVWDEIPSDAHSAFEKRDGRGQDIGPYDYGSIMHYSARAFSKTGKTTIITKIPNATIGQREGLSQYDRAAISFLYGNGSVAPQPPSPTPPQPTPPQPSPPSPQAWNGSFAGSYTSTRGEVTCTQNGSTVQCQFPGGSMLCSANGKQLDCGWSGGGQGRALFQRQGNGVVAGTYGDFFSTNSRGQWDLVPSGGASPQPNPSPSPAPNPAPSPSPNPGPQAATSLNGNYNSTRGPMTCTENATQLACTFTEAGAQGRLDCNKDANAMQLGCTWVTFLPRPGTGRAVLTRSAPSSRNLSGTWGHFTATSGGGQWDMTGQ